MEGPRPYVWGINGKEPYPVWDIGSCTEKDFVRPHVGDDTINGVRVSTVFLGIDHSFGNSRPVLFETMVFGGALDEYCERYHTWEEAENGHVVACRLVVESQTLLSKFKRGLKKFLLCFKQK